MSGGRLAQLLFPAVLRQTLSRTAQVQAALSRPDGETRPADPIRATLVILREPLALALEKDDDETARAPRPDSHRPRRAARLSTQSGSFRVSYARIPDLA